MLLSGIEAIRKRHKWRKIMGISIGNKNKIKNSIIAEKAVNSPKKERFADKHPVLISILISFVIGFGLMFTFWEKIVDWIERWF